MLLAKVSLFVTILAISSGHVLVGRVPRQAVSPTNAWGLHHTNKTLPYRMENNLSAEEKEEVFAAMRFWSENTCIDFREARAGDQYVANITKSDAYPSCSSPVGRHSVGRSEVKVGCGVYADVHEIGHLLGISHTQCRSDRDKFIKVDQARLSGTYVNAFVKSSYGLYGVPYDYGSIMHYDAGPRAAPRFVTTLPIYESTAGGRSHPSFYDVRLANIVNMCNDTCTESTTKCENGGYMHPRDCSKCICPHGFTGRTCTELVIVGNCGGILNASDQWKNVTLQINPEHMEQDVFNRSFCSWNIKAPNGKKIEISLSKIDTYIYCERNDLCSVGFEFKIGVDPRLTGPRFCCSSHLPSMVSQLNEVPIIAIGAIHDNFQMNFTTSFTYRFASEQVTTTSTTTTTESPTTTTTTSEAPTTRQMPKTTTNESTIIQSTTNAMSTSEMSTLPTTDTSTELPITTDDRTFYSTTDDESTSAPPTITHLSPTTTELSTESTNEVPIDCTTTYESSTPVAPTETSTVYPTTMEDPTITTTIDYSTIYDMDTTGTELPTYATITNDWPTVASTTGESTTTTTTTTEAPTASELPSTTTGAPILYSTTDALSTFEVSTFATSEAVTELPITTNDSTDYSSTDDDSTNEPPTTMRFPTTSELSTESTNDVPIDCTTTYETSTTEASTKTATEYPTTMEDTTTEMKDTSELPTSAYTITDNESPRTSESTASATAMSVSPTTTTTIELPATTELPFTTTTADATDCTTTNEFTNEFTSEPSSAIGESEICLLKNECFAFVPNAKAFEGLNKKPCLRIQSRCLGFVDSNDMCTCLWSY